VSAVAARPSPLVVYRDDGPLAALLATPAAALRLPGAPFAFAAAFFLLVAIVGGGDGVSDLAAGLTLGGAIVLGGIAGGRAEQGGFAWSVPPLIRFVEYGGLLWLGSLAGDDGVPAAFALICALAYRHYDLVYRLRHRGVTPPRWVDLVGLGWEGRLVLGYVVLLAGVLPAAFFILAGVLGVVFVAESVAGWTSSARSQRGSVYEEEEDEGQ
jgi:uncharacterized protein DUF5941